MKRVGKIKIKAIKIIWTVFVFISDVQIIWSVVKLEKSEERNQGS